MRVLHRTSARQLDNAFMRDFLAALEHHLLDVAQAQVEAKVEPNAVRNDLAREAITAVAGVVEVSMRPLHHRQPKLTIPVILQSRN
jgi:hypothetical protein